MNNPFYYSGCSGFQTKSPSASDKMSAIGVHWGSACPFYCEKSGKIEQNSININQIYLSKSSEIQACYWLSSVN